MHRARLASAMSWREYESDYSSQGLRREGASWLNPPSESSLYPDMVERRPSLQTMISAPSRLTNTIWGCLYCFIIVNYYCFVCKNSEKGITIQLLRQNNGKYTRQKKNKATKWTMKVKNCRPEQAK